MLEEGKFQLAFFDDRLAMPDIYGGNPAEVVANGVRVVKIDPVATMMAMGFGTKYWDRIDRLHNLLRAVRCGPPVPDRGPHAGRARGLERGDLGE